MVALGIFPSQWSRYLSGSQLACGLWGGVSPHECRVTFALECHLPIEYTACERTQWAGLSAFPQKTRSMTRLPVCRETQTVASHPIVWAGSQEASGGGSSVARKSFFPQVILPLSLFTKHSDRYHTVKPIIAPRFLTCSAAVNQTELSLPSELLLELFGL